MRPRTAATGTGTLTTQVHTHSEGLKHGALFLGSAPVRPVGRSVTWLPSRSALLGVTVGLLLLSVPFVASAQTTTAPSPTGPSATVTTTPQTSGATPSASVSPTASTPPATTPPATASPSSSPTASTASTAPSPAPTPTTPTTVVLADSQWNQVLAALSVLVFAVLVHVVGSFRHGRG